MQNSTQCLKIDNLVIVAAMVMLVPLYARAVDPVYTPDKKRMVCYNATQGQVELWDTGAQPSQPVAIAAFNGYPVSQLFINASGTRVATVQPVDSVWTPKYTVRLFKIIKNLSNQDILWSGNTVTREGSLENIQFSESDDISETILVYSSKYPFFYNVVKASAAGDAPLTKKVRWGKIAIVGGGVAMIAGLIWYLVNRKKQEKEKGIMQKPVDGVGTIQEQSQKGQISESVNA